MGLVTDQFLVRILFSSSSSMPSAADGIDETGDNKNSSGCLSEPDDSKKNSTGIDAKFDAQLSKIQQGSFDSSFDDSFVLRIKSESKCESYESDTGLGSISFGNQSISINSGDQDRQNCMMMGGTMLKASVDGEGNTFAAKILGFKVKYYSI